MRPAGGWRSRVGNEAQPQGYVPPACFAAPRSQDRQQLVLSRVGFLAGGRERHGQWRYFQEGHDRDGSWNLSGAIKWIRNNGKYQRILDLGRV